MHHRDMPSLRHAACMGHQLLLQTNSKQSIRCALKSRVTTAAARDLVQSCCDSTVSPPSDPAAGWIAAAGEAHAEHSAETCGVRWSCVCRWQGGLAADAYVPALCAVQTAPLENGTPCGREEGEEARTEEEMEGEDSEGELASSSQQTGAGADGESAHQTPVAAPQVVAPSPATVHQLPAMVLQLPAVVLQLPTAVLQLPAVVPQLPAIVLQLPDNYHECCRLCPVVCASTSTSQSPWRSS